MYALTSSVSEIDASPHFAPLFDLLEAVVETRDYTNPAVVERAAAGAVATRRAGISPETMIAYLRRRLHQAPLSAVGDWYRAVLVEHVVARAIDAYYDAASADPPSTHPDVAKS